MSQCYKLLYLDEQSACDELTSGVQADVKRITLDDGTCGVRKTSAGVDYAIELETIALRCVATLNLPHFVKLLYDGVADDKTFLVTKYVNGQQFSDMVFDNVRFNLSEKRHVVYQTLAAVEFLNDRLRINHNDLHTDNILVTESTADVNVYRFCNGKSYAIKTYGHCPVIIDFGLAYVPNERMMCSPIHLDSNQFLYKYSATADINQLLLHTCYLFGDVPLIKPYMTIDSYIYANKTMCDELTTLIRDWHRNDACTSNVFGLNCRENGFRDMLCLLLGKLTLPLTRVDENAIATLLSGYSNAQDAYDAHDNKYSYDKTSTLFATALVATRLVWTNTEYYTRTISHQLRLLKRALNEPNVDRLSDTSMPYNDLLELKRCLDALTMCTNNAMVTLSETISARKRDTLSSIQSVSEALDAMPIEPVVFETGMRVAVYDATTLRHDRYELKDEATVAELNKLYGK